MIENTSSDAARPLAGRCILVTGGAGYVGAVLVPKLLKAGARVRVLDICWYGSQVFDNVEGRDRLDLVVGDIRDAAVIKASMQDIDSVVHLACISNDPSFDLDPALGKSINLDAFRPMVQAAKAAGVSRFIYASSSSVYGLKEEPNVTEDLPLDPLTDYSRFKADCEHILVEERCPGFAGLVIRPATVCGWSPRLRLDLSVNILTNLAWHRGEITVFGGSQLRPNIHIADMTDLYCQVLAMPAEKIDGGIYNAGWQNRAIADIATSARDIVEDLKGEKVAIVTTSSDDLRSYHISSEKLKAELGFTAQYSIEDAMRDLADAFDNKAVDRPLDNPLYFNIKRMQELSLA